LQIKDEGQQILLIGKKLGRTRVTLGQKSLEFVVLHKHRRQTMQRLQRWAATKRGPKIQTVNGAVEVHGRLLRVGDLLELYDLSHDQFHFRNRMKLLPAIKKEIEDEINQRLQKNNLTPGQLSIHPEWSYRVAPTVKQQLNSYKKTLNPLGIQLVVDSLQIRQQPVVQMRLYIAYVKKSFLRQWGIQWPSQVQAQWIPSQAVQWQGLEASFNALEQQGEGYLLATPTLITESHQSAEFHSGGEIPIRTTTQFNNNVEWKRYGLFIKALPRANAQRHLQIDVDIEMSALDQEAGVGDLPALTRNHSKTRVNLQRPQPILLAGFLRSQQGQARSGLPWLAQIPLLQPLFSNGQIYNRDYELVFLLFPSFYESHN
jgi:hypothetical protein